MFNQELRDKLKQYLAAEVAGPMPIGSNAIASAGIDKVGGYLKGLLDPAHEGPVPTNTPMPPQAPTPATPPVMAPKPPISALPAVNTPPISAPPAPLSPPEEAQPSNPYDDAARQQLYSDLEGRMKRGAGFQAIGGIADTLSRAGGSKPTEYSDSILKQTTDANKTATDRFDAGRKGSREELADYLSQKKDTRDFAFKEKEAGLKHEEVAAAREANAIARAALAADRAAKNKETNDMKMDKMIQHHADGLNKDQIPQLLNAYNELIPQFNSGKDVAGIGMLDQMVPGAMLSTQGQANRMRLAQMANVFLKLRSGAAVTDPEYARFLNESNAGKVPTEAAARQWMKHMGSDMKLAMGLAESGLPPEALAEYKTRPTSVKMEDIYGYKPNQAAPQQAQAPKQHPQDNEAVMWAKANSQDPRAAKILAANGL